MKLAASYFGNRMLRHVREDMESLRARGFERVIHTFSENDFAFYRGTMRDIVRVSTECGLETLLDPWGVARVFGGEAYSGWLLEEPDLYQRGPSGRILGGSCLNHPGLRPRLRAWIEAAAETGAKWIFWDEPHWVPRGPRNPEGEMCVCEHCRARLAELSPGIDIRKASHDEMLRMRGRAISELLDECTREAARHGLSSSVCVLPSGFVEQPPLDWAYIAGLEAVDEFGTDPYWQAFDQTGEKRAPFIDEHAGRAIRVCREARIPAMLWVQAFRIRATEEEEMVAGVRDLLRHAPDTVAIWGFEACAFMSSLSSERPAIVWDALIRALHEGGTPCAKEGRASGAAQGSATGPRQSRTPGRRGGGGGR